MHQSYLKSPAPSQISLIKKCKKSYFVIEKKKIPKDQRKKIYARVRLRAGHLRYFLIISKIKNDFCLFLQVNLTGSGLFK